MKSHEERKKHMSSGVLPEVGTQAYKHIREKFDKDLASNPSLKKDLDKQFERSYNLLTIQDANGINVNMDNEIRHFLREFNGRAWTHGLRSMPLMFNIMEAYFKYNRSSIFFELLEEEDCLFSFFSFFDFYTSDKV